MNIEKEDDRTLKSMSYTVARHTFGIVMPGDSPLWQEMNAYCPFEAMGEVSGVDAASGVCDASEAVASLFTLTVCSDIPLADAVPVFVGQGDTTGANVYRTPDGHLFELLPYGTDELSARVRIDSCFRRAQVALYGATLRQCAMGLNSAAMLCFALASAELDTLLMHASVVTNGGRAYLFLGRSGTGKSTHSRLWMQHVPGSELLNDDHPILRIGPKGQVIAYGSPWSGKTPCYRNLSAPVGAIVRISRAPHNRLLHLAPVAAYASLRPSTSGMSWEEALENGRDRTLQHIVRTTLCCNMQCLPDGEAALVCAAGVRNQAIAGKEASCND